MQEHLFNLFACRSYAFAIRLNQYFVPAETCFASIIMTLNEVINKLHLDGLAEYFKAFWYSYFIHLENLT